MSGAAALGSPAAADRVIGLRGCDPRRWNGPATAGFKGVTEGGDGDGRYTREVLVYGSQQAATHALESIRSACPTTSNSALTSGSDHVMFDEWSSDQVGYVVASRFGDAVLVTSGFATRSMLPGGPSGDARTQADELMNKPTPGYQNLVTALRSQFG